MLSDIHQIVFDLFVRYFVARQNGSIFAAIGARRMHQICEPVSIALVGASDQYARGISSDAHTGRISGRIHVENYNSLTIIRSPASFPLSK
jgi:hypothetical protein